MSKEKTEIVDEKVVVEATRTAEEMMNAIKSGEIAELFGRVQAAQEQIRQVKAQNQVQNELAPHDVVSLTSLIMSDMIKLMTCGYHVPAETQNIIDAVIRAGTIQHAKMLGVQFTEGKKS